MKRKYDDNTQLTAHFNAHEFKCKCGKPHDFELSDDLSVSVAPAVIAPDNYDASSHGSSGMRSGYGNEALGLSLGLRF